MSTKGHSFEYPATYKTNSPKELLVLDYVENFRRQYVQLFPSRPPLLLTPENECNVKKFVCLTVRPTELPFAECYELDTCVAFISQFCEFQPLSVPNELPKRLSSPATVARVQKANSFELSVLITSALLGVGFDAYVVVGFAKKHVCERDLSLTECDVSVKIEIDDDGNKKDEEKKSSKYDLGERNGLLSRFVQRQEEEKKKEKEKEKEKEL
eukprot:TRINITY_DN1823_c1_g1_i1.p1 TRINITY_DN1823_c1_g1~~TRINITY_DN1823_c1_g1_i1.p1  ORF type:complete len:212 (+),score=62.18 TRINITY_DN1823_c1_g1_i1:132-767(+)